MYTKVYLTDKYNTPLSLSNMQFDNDFELVEDIYDCENVNDLVGVVNSHNPLTKFEFMKDNDKKTILFSMDRYGNKQYLVCLK